MNLTNNLRHRSDARYSLRRRVQPPSQLMCMHLCPSSGRASAKGGSDVTECLFGPQRLLYVCVDSICDSVCVIGLRLDVLPVCVCSIYTLYACVWAVLIRVLCGESDKSAELRNLVKTSKLTVEVLPRPPYKDRTKTLEAVRRDVRWESKRERRRMWRQPWQL